MSRALLLAVGLALGCSGSAPETREEARDPNAPPVPRFEPRHRFAAHPGENRPLMFSADGRLLASRSPREGFQLWDVESGRIEQSFEEVKGRITALSFSPDGRHVYADEVFTGGVGVWNVSTGKKVRAFSGANRNPALSADGGFLAAGGTVGEIFVWDVRTGDERRRLRGHAGDVTVLAFSPQSQWLASGGNDRTARVWDVDSGRQSRLLSGHRGSVLALAFSPDGRSVATGGEDKLIFIWDASSGERIRALPGHQSDVRGLAFSRDGALLFSGGQDDMVRIWNPASGKELKSFAAQVSGIQAIALSPDGRRLAASGKSDVRVWDLH